MARQVSSCKRRFDKPGGDRCPVCGSNTKNCNERDDGMFFCRGANKDVPGFKCLGPGKGGDDFYTLSKDAGDVQGYQWSQPTEFYDYLDEGGVLRFQTVRNVPKGFWQRRPQVPNPRNDDYRKHGGDWINSTRGIDLFLFR